MGGWDTAQHQNVEQQGEDAEKSATVPSHPGSNPSSTSAFAT
jgi:hypothetical protein